ncbi:hypothetical protein MTsPCn9_34270 [Croceitalea sp. MTPC9]|uniref:DUF4138 domain-containing protein n=1 Tax=unclassified Croceitalea TaxID=2632280 RepID=UPI002B39CB8F|nr:hypothetical protein MTsPCn6_34680 [Croceitalea sp. MTPC6]GMN18487.1 hypothetical protein MTsPCn9_34270 [Croceitalea sp. MTPC9]
MAKKIFNIFIFIVPACFFGQDTIQVAKMYKTIMIFPEPVTETILGNDLSFVLEQHSRETDYGKRILKVSYNKMGKEKNAYTNLVAITESGSFYEFILSKSDKPSKLTYNIQNNNRSFSLRTESTNDKGPIVVENEMHKYSSEAEIDLSNVKIEPEEEEPTIATEELYENNRTEYFKSMCYYNQFNKSFLLRHFEKAGNVFLRVGGIYYNKNELYFQVIIDNQEPIDYDVNFIKFSIATNYKKASSNQSTEIPPIFRYKVPKKVKGFSKNHFFVVFDKFTLDRNKVFKIDLDELNGNRNITLMSDNQMVNRPKRF